MTRPQDHKTNQTTKVTTMAPEIPTRNIYDIGVGHICHRLQVLITIQASIAYQSRSRG
jgi:hypothetical protein